jgi:transposase
VNPDCHRSGQTGRVRRLRIPARPFFDSWAVSLLGADRCAATHSATINGTGSRTCCPAGRARWGVTARDNRLFVQAVLYRYRSGIPCRDLPERFSDPIKVHTRFSRWAKSGVWERVFQSLAADADNEYAMIDSTIVRAHQHSAGAQKKPEKVAPRL